MAYFTPPFRGTYIPTNEDSGVAEEVSVVQATDPSGNGVPARTFPEGFDYALDPSASVGVAIGPYRFPELSIVPEPPPPPLREHRTVGLPQVHNYVAHDYDGHGHTDLELPRNAPVAGDSSLGLCLGVSWRYDHGREAIGTVTPHVGPIDACIYPAEHQSRQTDIGVWEEYPREHDEPQTDLLEAHRILTDPQQDEGTPPVQADGNGGILTRSTSENQGLT